MLEAASLEQALRALGHLLQSRKLSLELVGVGGGGLLLLHVLSRPTRDLDIVALVEGDHYVKAAPLPAALVEAASEVAQMLGIGPDWLNAGPTDLLDLGLPEGFAHRTEVRRYGALTLHLAGRRDQIFLKLYAAVDQGASSKHFQDLKLLQPSPDELVEGARWALTHDPSEAFRAELVGALADLGVRDAASLL